MGHIFQLGTKYAEALDLKVLDQNGKLVTVIMGSYGVGVSRAVACVAEGNHDELGLRLAARDRARPTCTSSPPARTRTVFVKAEEIARELEAQGLTVIFDDRKGVSPGVKFKDSELIGVPTIVVVGRGAGRRQGRDQGPRVRASAPRSPVDDVVDAVAAAVPPGPSAREPAPRPSPSRRSSSTGAAR